MEIRPDGVVDVVETLDVDFAQHERHGIFRYITVRLPYEPDDKYERVYKISDVKVTATGGASAKNEISDTGPNKIFKIGDKDKTISGAHTYRISYRIRGALNGFDDHDELYWNVIGLDWQIPIDKARHHRHRSERRATGEVLHRPVRIVRRVPVGRVDLGARVAFHGRASCRPAPACRSSSRSPRASCRPRRSTRSSTRSGRSAAPSRRRRPPSADRLASSR